MENGSRRRSEVEVQVLDKVGEVISEFNEAKHVDQVICALHSLAILLFPLDASLFSGNSQTLTLVASASFEVSNFSVPDRLFGFRAI